MDIEKKLNQINEYKMEVSKLITTEEKIIPYINEIILGYEKIIRFLELRRG